MQHTEHHLNCPACLQKAQVPEARLDPRSKFAVAVRDWIQSREFPATTSGRARFVAPHSITDFNSYARALSRFFGELPLHEIHLGHIRVYQEQRAAGLLGPTREELFPEFAKRIARKFRVELAEIQLNPQMLAIVNAQIDAYPQREVGPNKINQEVGMLIAVLKKAGVWTQHSEDNYEALQHQESDVPRCLNPAEQERFIQAGLEAGDGYIGQYSIIGIHCTLSTLEERSIKLGDINLTQRVLMVRVASSKNKHRTRTIPLTDTAVWAFERLVERANLLGAVEPQHCLFPRRIVRNHFDPNRPMTVSGIKKPWNEVRRAAGVPWFTPYMLRHTGCTRYAEDGVSIHVLLAMAGHMSRKMQQHYIHISEAAKRRAVDRTYGLQAKAAASVKLPAVTRRTL